MGFLTFFFDSSMLDLQAGESCFSFSLRHLAIRPSPGFMSLQYFATSSAQGP